MRERVVGWECQLMGILRVCYSKSRDFFYNISGVCVVWFVCGLSGSGYRY
jgi:hypothetical protein